MASNLPGLSGPGIPPSGATNMGADVGTNTVPDTSLDGSNSNTVTAAGTDDIPIMFLYINDSSWPVNFKLNIKLNNWVKWSMQASLLVGHQGFAGYLDGSLPPPNTITHAKAHHIWQSNDYSLKCCLLAHISMHDYDSVNKFPTTHAIFDALHKTHERWGVHTQAMLIREALDIHCNMELELLKTIDDIRMLHK